MSIKEYHIVMAGYNISHLAGYIWELEAAEDEKWIDGLPGYSLNFPNVETGYEHHTKSMFGKVLFESDNVRDTDGWAKTDLTLPELEGYRKAIWEKYKQFLFDHTKITDKDKKEPPFIVRIISYWA